MAKASRPSTFLCTRPRLAGRLLSEGIECRVTIHPWDISRKAWECDITPELIQIAKAFYDEIGSPLPIALTAAERGGAKE